MTNREAIEILRIEREDFFAGQPIGEALFMAIKALETQEPVQIRKIGDGLSKCPICRNWLKEGMDFCDKCGQAIDWRADNEPYR